jgi:hypothetical protein
VGRQRADAQLAELFDDVLQLRKPAHIDEADRLDEPQVEHGDEAVASRQKPCLAAVPGQRIDCGAQALRLSYSNMVGFTAFPSPPRI